MVSAHIVGKAGRCRGRPRKEPLNDVATTGSPAQSSIGNSPATAWSSSSNRRSSHVALHLSSPPCSEPFDGKKIVIQVEDTDDLSELSSPSTLPQYTTAMTAKKQNFTAGRGSLSSVATSTEANDNSDYSTPLTSGVNTPAVAAIKSAGPKHRGRAATAMSTIATPLSMSGPARLKALQSSKFSLESNKRKFEEDEEEEANSDGEDSADARLARQLQEEEDSIMISDAIQYPARRRTTRTLKTLRPNMVINDSDEEDFKNFSLPPAKKPKVELSKVSNPVDFKTKKSIVEDTEDSEGFQLEDSDDSDLSFVATSAIRSTRAATRNSELQLGLCDESNIPLAKASPAGKISRFKKHAAKSKPSDIAIEAGRIEISETSDIESTELDPSDDDLDDDMGIDAYAALPTRLSGLNRRVLVRRLEYVEGRRNRRAQKERQRLESHHPELHVMWKELEDLPKIGQVKIEQPKNINRDLKPFQLEGVAWMRAMEETSWGGGLLGDEMGMGKTIQAVTLIMSDFPAAQPSLVLIPPVALMQWQQEIADYTDGTLKTFVYHGTNVKTKGIKLADLQKYDVILMSYNSLESMYRKQEKGFRRKGGIYREKSLIHQIRFHRVILDEAHNIKQRTSGSAKACFALKADHKWCLSGTPLQNRIGEFFSLVRFLDIQPFACYFCKQCSCSKLEWEMNEFNRCAGCNHSGMQHVSVFNQELLNPIQKFGNKGPGKEAFRKLRILTDRFMLRRVKRDHSSSMELPAKEIYVDRHFFGEEENDFAGSIMNNGTRKFETYVAQGVLLNNYANIFGLIMQMRQVADHPDLILKKNGEGGQNILVCCICDETAEEAIRSNCRHDFCRECARNYLTSSDSPDCPQCHIALAIDLEQPSIEQDQTQVKKSSIINRIKMENWTSSSKIEALVHDLYLLRSKNSSTKSIIFSQFTTMLQLVEWRLRRAGITTVMLDGSMTPAQRQASINHFMTDVNVECFLVSLKAGGVALNLTEASHVFIVDPWWNPAAEWQSADRCHRIGQARPCSITRLCIEDSVESRMVLLQEKKANMINSTINSDDSAMESLTPEDMQFLFRGN